jgi:hypothetical protein
MFPEGALRWQRLLVEYVEPGVGEVAGVEGGDEIGDDDVRAAGDVDEAAAFLDSLQVPEIEDAFRLRGQRKKADGDVGFFQDGLKVG